MTSEIDVPANWYEHFFTATVNRFWEAMVPAEATEADLAFILRHLDAVPPSRLLDVPCGAGRHALALAAQGFEVTGVDLSADAVSRASAAAGELPARFIRSDMRDFTVEARFDAILCLGNSIGYLGADGMAAFFAKLASSIRRDGRLILDSYTCAESIFPLAEERDIAFEGGSYRSRFDYDAMRSALKTEAELLLDGELHRLRYEHQIITSGELVRALKRAGFATSALYGDTDDAPYAIGSQRLLLVAAKT